MSDTVTNHVFSLLVVIPVAVSVLVKLAGHCLAVTSPVPTLVTAWTAVWSVIVRTAQDVTLLLGAVSVCRDSQEIGELYFSDDSSRFTRFLSMEVSILGSLNMIFQNVVSSVL